MPGNLQPASPVGILPNSLSTSFTETGIYPILSALYHDGTLQRYLIQDGVNPPRSLRVWSLSKRLSTSQLTSLLSFWESTVFGGLNSFYFYPRYQDYDGSGTSTTGRVTVFFRGNWEHRTELGRHVVPNLVLVEVA